MAVFSVNYDLSLPGTNYQGLINEIKKCSKWWHGLGSTWLVVTNESAKQILDRLLPYIDGNDKMLIVQLRGEGTWASCGFHADMNAWLHKNA